MATLSWIRRLFDRKPRTVRKGPRPVSGRDRGARPRLECLEDRTLLSLTLSPIGGPLGNLPFPNAIAVGDLTGDGLPNVVAVDAAAMNGPSFDNGPYVCLLYTSPSPRDRG